MTRCIQMGALAASVAFMPAPTLAQEDGSESDAIDTVVVTATRTQRNVLDVPASVSVQNMDELYERGFFSSPDELRGVPGVFFQRGEGDNDEFPTVTVRGVTGNHGNDTFLALVDGIPFISGNEEVLLAQVPFAAIEQIEVVRGPVSALYGRGGISGAVHYRTRRPRENATGLSLSAGSDAYYRAGLTLERDLGEARLLADLSYEEADGWRVSNARRLFNLFAKGEVDVTASTTLTAFLNYGDRRHEAGSVIPTMADGTPVDVLGGREGGLLYGQPFGENETLMAALRVDHRFSDELDVQVTAHARRVDNETFLNFYDSWLFDPDNDLFGVNGFESDSRTEAAFLEAVSNWRTGRHDIVVGANVERVAVDSLSIWSGQHGFTFECGFEFYAVRINYRTGEVVNADHPCFIRDPRDETDTTNAFWSVFVQDEISLTDRLTLTLGGRYDAFKRDTDFRPPGNAGARRTLSDSESAFSPKASLAHDFGDGMVYAAFGRGFSSNFGPIWQWDANQYTRDSRPTTLDSYELGVKGRLADRRFTYTLTGFYLEQKNRPIIIDNPDPTGPPNLTTTGQRYTSRGVEATGALRLNDRTGLYASYTWMRPEWAEYEVEGVVLTGLKPTGVPAHTGFIELRHELRDTVTLKASWEIYGNYHITRDNAHRGGGHNLLNASASIALPWHDDLGLELAVTNLLDKDYEYLFGGQNAVTHLTPGIPRQLRAMLRVRL